LRVFWQVYFAPYKSHKVAKIDLATNQFSELSTVVGSGNYHYTGAVAIGTEIILSPGVEANVGVINTATDAVSQVSFTPQFGNPQYTGAAAIGTKAYFTPGLEPTVGIFDTAVGQRTLAKQALTGLVSAGPYYQGNAAVVGTKLFFAPSRETNVGVFETATNAWSTINVASNLATAASGDPFYSQALFLTGPGGTGQVVLTPYKEAKVGYIDPSSNAVYFGTYSALTAAAAVTQKYNGAAIVGQTAYMTPAAVSVVGKVKWMANPTAAPTAAPTTAPSSAPTAAPTSAPTSAPVPPVTPTAAPTFAPVSPGTPTGAPTVSPTAAPTAPTGAPTVSPTAAPTASPTVNCTSTSCSSDDGKDDGLETKVWFWVVIGVAIVLCLAALVGAVMSQQGGASVKMQEHCTAPVMGTVDMSVYKPEGEGGVKLPGPKTTLAQAHGKHDIVLNV